MTWDSVHAGSSSELTALTVPNLTSSVATHGFFPARAASRPRIETFARIADCESLWRAFQDSGTATPFQRVDWVAAFLGSRLEDGPEIRIVVVRDAAGEPAMLLPLAIERRLGLRIASVIGGKQANYKMPVLAKSGGLPASELSALLVAAGASLRVDTFQFLGAPETWDGAANPFAARGRPSPSNAFRLALGTTGEETLSRILDRGQRRKLRQKENWLARLGTVGHLEPTGPEAIDRVLDVFFRQKGERLRSLGLHDPFSCGHARALLRAGCEPAAPGLPPAIELHALTLDERIVAVFAGAVDPRRMSGMVISFDSAEDVARCSPGDLLIARVIAAQCRRGRQVFDLGVGEARYKRSFCDTVEPLVDILIPVTENGRLYASATRLAMDAKRLVKQSSWTMRLIGTMRRSTALLT